MVPNRWKCILCRGSHFFSISTAARLIWLQRFIQVEQLIAADCPPLSSEHSTKMSQTQTRAPQRLHYFLITAGGRWRSQNKLPCSAVLRTPSLTRRWHTWDLCRVGTSSDSAFCHLHPKGWIKATFYNTLTPVAIRFILHSSWPAYTQLLYFHQSLAAVSAVSRSHISCHGFSKFSYQ